MRSTHRASRAKPVRVVQHDRVACALVLYGLVARGLEVFAERAIVIDELTMAQSLRKAWRMFTTNFIRVANVALALFFISMGTSVDMCGISRAAG